jgi:hypothetical protein
MDKKKTAFIGGTGYARDGKVPPSEQYLKELQEWNPSWCPVPWTSYGINNNGDYRMRFANAVTKKMTWGNSQGVD